MAPRQKGICREWLHPASRKSTSELNSLHFLSQEVRRQVRINQRHLDVAVSQDALQRQDVAAVHDEVRGKSVAQRMPRMHRNPQSSRLQQRWQTEQRMCGVALSVGSREEQASGARRAPPLPQRL